MKYIMSHGMGVDSTALMIIATERRWAAGFLGIPVQSIHRAIPQLDAVVFADPGTEHRETYEYERLVTEPYLRGHGIEYQNLQKCLKSGEYQTLLGEMKKRGTIPVMPGGKHTCSVKFKAEVQWAWAADRYPGEEVTWYLGFEADEAGRKKRYNASPEEARKKGQHFLYPLMDLGVTREIAKRLILAFGWEVPRKSSCVFCPFKSGEEIIFMCLRRHAELQITLEMEDDFRRTSPIKHARYREWLKGGGDPGVRAPRGTWRLDSWAAGVRLFTARVSWPPGTPKRQLSVGEWCEYAKYKEKTEREQTSLVVFQNLGYHGGVSDAAT